MKRTMLPTLTFLLIVFGVFAQSHAATPNTTKNNTTIANSALKTNVSSALERQFLLPFQVNVDKPGNVILKGTVNRYTDKLRAFEIASQVPGVKKISDRLLVSTDPIPDDKIEADIHNNLIINTHVAHPQRILIAVDHGTAIIDGTVDTHQEAEAVEDIAGWVPGVKGVVNRLNTLYVHHPRGPSDPQSVIGHT